MSPLLERLNAVLKGPTPTNIFKLFEREGFLRFNMLYISPIALCHFWQKLQQYGLRDWYFTENEFIFEIRDRSVIFRGVLALTANNSKIFCVELDFDTMPANDSDVEFLRDIEIFLKKCDSCFFMTYSICIDSEILANPISQSIEFLLSRK